MDDGAGTRMRPFDLLVVGEVNPDILVSDPDPHPVFGQVERLVREVRLAIGSSSAITACAAARLGLRVAMVGVVGADDFGRYMTDALQARGVDVSAVRVADDLPTGASVILSDGQDRAILTARGTIGAVTARDVTPALLAAARHLHIGSWFLQDGLRDDAGALLAAARQAGLTTSLDPNWDPSGGWDGGLRDLLRHLDLLFPNQAELARISDDDAVETAAVKLAALGPLVAVKCGADGALVASPDGIVARVGAYGVSAVDTTGAGDTFDAGFLAAWLDGASPADALRAGAVAGALATTALGGTAGQPTMTALRAALGAWTA
jgi:sugar/nucleoside kinase (ribokinase family)